MQYCNKYRHLTFAIITLIQLIGNAKSQRLDVVKAIKHDADSVWIISHEVTGIGIRKENGESELRLLFKNGKLDSSLLKESRKLSKLDRIKLAEILAKPNTEMKTEMGKCYFPQHAIILKKGRKVSWIEVCFSCQKMESSDDLKINFFPIDNPKWAKIQSFFKHEGLKYELY
jgi:hypothetical protein